MKAIGVLTSQTELSAEIVVRRLNELPRDAFDKKIVVAVIKRGNAVTEYKVEQVTAGDGTLYVQYSATEKNTAASARSLRSQVLGRPSAIPR